MNNGEGGVRERRKSVDRYNVAAGGHHRQNGYNYLDDDVDVSKKLYSVDRGELGYRHWLSIVIFVAALYGTVVYQDLRMPPVVPKNATHQFSEERALETLREITDLGPRPSGSHALEVDAFQLLKTKIHKIGDKVADLNVNRLEVDVQHPTGCYNLKFLSAFTLCYHKITNIVVRIGPKSGPTEQAILLNCHFDTLPDTPGATDDAVSCAIMMDVLNVFGNSTKELQNDVLFLFNGAEENFLQGSHGFISQHPWRHPIRAFINLEGTGSGGREILFQAGPGDSWLLKTYLDNAPHPHCSVLAQEIFQSGIIPSDTDFRVFRDYGRISGLDIAYHRNGWVYHTEFDRMESIHKGAVQRAGENVLAVSKALILSKYLKQPARFNEGNKWVFYDFVGLFTVIYEVNIGSLINLFFVLSAVFLVIYRASFGTYLPSDLGVSFLHHIGALTLMLLTGVGITLTLTSLNLVMMWYGMPELVFIIYIVPMINIGLWVHAYVADRSWRGPVAELAHYDSALLIWAALLLLMTVKGLASSFFALFPVVFPLMRDILIYVLAKIGLFRVATPKVVLLTQCVCLLPVMAFVSYATMLFYDFFVPVMGRTGNVMNPEWLIMPLSLCTAFTFVLYTNNLIYVSRRLMFLIRCSFLVSLLAILIVATTRLGAPYKYSEESPRLRRLIALHSKRNVFDFSGKKVVSDWGLLVMSFDYRGVDDLPENAFLKGMNKLNCSDTLDEYCRMPYYTAIHELFPPEKLRYIPVPFAPNIPRPISVELVSKEATSANTVRLTVKIEGGTDKMSLHITPLDGYRVSEWSFSPFKEVQQFGHRNTYFVFMSYGHQAPTNRMFWVNLVKDGKLTTPLEKTPTLELAVATHYAHGKYQNTEVIRELRELIASRRRSTHAEVGGWRWASTMIGGASEIVVHQF